MRRQNQGQYLKGSTVPGEPYHSYLPNPLPPNPPLELRAILAPLEKANTALGRLDGMLAILPNPQLFLYWHVRKEATLSSQIEGTQSTLSDLLLFENTQTIERASDVQEISSYVDAMEYGLQRMEQLPLCLRLLREIHERLMRNARGQERNPGEFRRVQNWIGGRHPSNADFVPPPPDELMECLGDFEKFLNDGASKLPTLIKAALAHVQFEIIHPFLDGNGRIGRMLIILMLCAAGLLKQPLLYLSLHFKQHRQEYYRHLQSVRETGDWEAWIEFFLDGVIAVSDQATRTMQDLLKLFAEDQERIKNAGLPASTLHIHACMQELPICGTGALMRKTQWSHPTVMRGLTSLQGLDIVKEITGKERRRVFAYYRHLDILMRE